MPITEVLRKALDKKNKEAELINREDPAERRAYDNMLADAERVNAILDYIAACDYPEVFEDEDPADMAGEMEE